MLKSEKESNAIGTTPQPAKFGELRVKPHGIVQFEIGSMVFENHEVDP